MPSRLLTLSGDNDGARSPRETRESLARKMGRLGSMVASYKLANGEAPIMEPDRSKMIRAAGLSPHWDRHPFTNRVMSASAGELGKGGNIFKNVGGAISHAVSAVAKPIQSVVQKVANPIEAAVSKIPIVGTAGAQLIKISTGGTNIKTAAADISGQAQSLAPYLAKIPGVGPALGAVVGVAGNLGSQVLGVGQKLTQDPLGALAMGAGDVLGDVGSVVDGAFHGLASFPGQAFSGIEGLLSAGKSLAQRFGADTWAAIEKTSPSLSGELTSIFHGLGSTYTGAQYAFDKWSSSLKGAGAGSYVGKIGSNFYTIIKDVAGHFRVSQTPAGNASPSLTNLIPEGGLIPADSTVLASPQSPVGGYPPIPWNGQGQPMTPAGYSLPPGPSDAAGMTGDGTSTAMLNSALADRA
ncbi:MAG: hypothetical protein KGO96_13660, partial [Elusimicrobia bacterium]|nr:hypothetical protein [Elusimicrobiota bacterium]